MKLKRIALLLAALSSAWCCRAGVRDMTVKVLETYPHNTDAYTQGLFFHEGKMYETTGQYGESSIRQVDLESGKVLRKVSLTDKYFGEGSCIVDGNLYLLTWKNRVAFVYDAETFKYKKTLAYPRDGWGLAPVPRDMAAKLKPGKVPAGTGDVVMVSSDGSSNLYYLDNELRLVRTVKVKLGDMPVRLLNELEWIDGKIWANVYTTDMIVVIDPLTGEIEGKIDCSSLIPQSQRDRHMDVLNGIAQGPDGSIYLTGKYWPKLFKIKTIF